MVRLCEILPLAFYLKDRPSEEGYRIIREVSALTHAHARAVIGCFIYIRFMMSLLEGQDKNQAYLTLRNFIPDFCREYCHFLRI